MSNKIINMTNIKGELQCFNICPTPDTIKKE